MNTSAVLRVFLWGICVFHIVVGLALNLDLGLKEWVGSSLYGAIVDWSDEQFVYILKPLGAFMIALGVMAGIAARDPLGKRAIVYGFALLFTLRGLQRLVFMADTQAAFGIAPGRSIGTMIVMLALAAVLLFLARASSGSPVARPQPARP